MSGGLQGPDPGVPILGQGNVPQQPSAVEVLSAQLMAVQQGLDMLFQAMMRLHLGWTAEQVIEDMELNVAPVPTPVFETLKDVVDRVVAEGKAEDDLADPPEGDLEDQAAAILRPNRAARRASAKKKGNA